MSSRNARIFMQEPNITKPRSVFDLSCEHISTGNTGRIIPFHTEEVLPGDTIKLGVSSLTRMETLIAPIFSRIICDIDYFFVPNRIIWDHWQEFISNENRDPYEEPTTYTVPLIKAPHNGGWKKGTIADYMGIPINVPDIEVSQLLFRAYAKICDDWYRSEYLQSPVNIDTGDATQTGTNGDDYITDLKLGGMPMKATKLFDMFTACLQEPQIGEAVELPLGQNAQVYTGTEDHTLPTSETLHFKTTGGQYGNNGDYNLGIRKVENQEFYRALGTNDTITTTGQKFGILPSNLYADLSTATATTVNDLRLAFQTQKMLELDARAGSRYFEYLNAHFGVRTDDAVMQRAQYLGGQHFDIQVNQVLQQSESGTTPQGTTTGYSVTKNYTPIFTSSFEEHGWIIGMCIIRYPHAYEQGIPKKFLRTKKLDFYDPLLDNIGNQPIYECEIYATPENTNTDEKPIFGYNEAWIQYRTNKNMITGEMRSQYEQTLNSWHLGDNYEEAPTLSNEWIQEDSNIVNRVIAVDESNADQFKFDWYIDCKAYRTMQVHSIPGFIDHH